MRIARHEDGPAAAARALASQIHPVFMLPPVACSAFGAALAGAFDMQIALVHTAAMFFAVYTAHVKDGYVDFYLREEDDDHPLAESGCTSALAGATVGFAVCTLVLGVWVGAGGALITVPAWLISYFHAPQLDMNPITVTMGYPAGIALAIVGGYYAQAETLTATVVAFASVFLIVLTGIKVVDDTKDYEYDRSIGKRTVAVVLGRERARATGYAAMAAGLLAVCLLAGAGVFPPSSALAVAAFAVVALFARRAGDNDVLATMLLIRGSYVFLALLIVSVWFRPLA